MKTIEEAYEFTLSMVEELIAGGIEANYAPCPSKDDSKMVEECSEVGLNPKYWVHVVFKKLNRQKSKRIGEVLDYLGMCGITFDFFGCKKELEWEIDWSFSFSKGDKTEWRDAANTVQDLINSE